MTLFGLLTIAGAVLTSAGAVGNAVNKTRKEDGKNEVGRLGKKK